MPILQLTLQISFPSVFRKKYQNASTFEKLTLTVIDFSFNIHCDYQYQPKIFQLSCFIGFNLHCTRLTRSTHSKGNAFKDLEERKSYYQSISTKFLESIHISLRMNIYKFLLRSFYISLYISSKISLHIKVLVKLYQTLCNNFVNVIVSLLKSNYFVVVQSKKLGFEIRRLFSKVHKKSWLGGSWKSKLEIVYTSMTNSIHPKKTNTSTRTISVVLICILLSLENSWLSK